MYLRESIRLATQHLNTKSRSDNAELVLDRKWLHRNYTADRTVYTSETPSRKMQDRMEPSVFDFNCTSISGESASLSRFRGKVALIVNTASYCGFTPQFKGLEFLYRRYQERGFVVLGFPCNQFANQDPYDNERISDFCVRNYGVSFPMFAKIQVNGENTDPLFDYLKVRAPGLFGSQLIKWNFTKFLIDRNGNVMGRFGPTSFPRRLSQRIERLLEQ